MPHRPHLLQDPVVVDSPADSPAAASARKGPRVRMEQKDNLPPLLHQRRLQRPLPSPVKWQLPPSPSRLRIHPPPRPQ